MTHFLLAAVLTLSLSAALPPQAGILAIAAGLGVLLAGAHPGVVR